MAPVAAAAPTPAPMPADVPDLISFDDNGERKNQGKDEHENVPRPARRESWSQFATRAQSLRVDEAASAAPDIGGGRRGAHHLPCQQGMPGRGG